MKIDKPGIYTMPAEAYHADPCPQASLSSGIVKRLADETPLHAFIAHPKLNPQHEEEDEPKFDIGTAAHAIMLNDPQHFAILDFKDYRTKDAQAARFNAKQQGRPTLLRHQFDRVMEMVLAGREQMDGSIDFAQCFKNGKPEQTLIWTEGDGKDLIWCRARLDWLHDDRNLPYDDYKSTGIINPRAWVRNIMLSSVRHDIQAAWYRRGIRALGLNSRPTMRFVLQEPEQPFCISGVEVGGEIIELADREIEKALTKWRLCRSINYWPGMPAKFHRAQAPEYLEARRMEKEVERDDLVKEAGGEQALFEASFRRQAPEPSF